MTREILSSYQGENNVTKVTGDNGSISYLTQSISFAEEANATGASKLNTVENEKKHVLFMFNSADAETGRYYLGKKLQGMTPDELVEKRHMLCFFKSWNPNVTNAEGKVIGGWVPCVGLSSQESLAAKAVSF
jgi:hypothetical protein